MKTSITCKHVGENCQLLTVGHFAAVTAHDLRNLLAIILGNVELIAEETPMASDIFPMLELIRSAGERGERLTGDLQAATEALLQDPAAGQSS